MSSGHVPCRRPQWPQESLGNADTTIWARSPETGWKVTRSRRGRPASKYSQSYRLLDLYDRLHRGETLRASAVAQALGMDKRTLQRDFAVLRELLGARIEQVDEPEAGLRLARERRRWGTTKWQVLAVALGARMSGFLSGRSFDTQVSPLLSELHDSLASGHALDVHKLEQKLHVIESGQKLYRKSPATLRRLDEMLDALLLQQPVDLVYGSPGRRARGDASLSLRVQALCMTVHRGGVYFVVEILGGDLRVGRRILLALDRLQEVTVDRQAERRRHPRDFRAAEFFGSAFGIWTGDERHRVRIRISRDYADAVRERFWHATQRVAALPDGSLRVQMMLGSLNEITDWILGMGEHAKVEGPPELVERVTGRLRATLAQCPTRSGATYSVAPKGHAGLRRRKTPPVRERRR